MMISLFKKVISDMKHQPHDERVASIRGNASWYGLFALLISYLAIGATYIVKNGPIPWQFQTMFFVPLLVFFVTNLKHNGPQFTIPGMKETEETLDQPVAVRSLPWLTSLFGLIITADMFVFVLNPLFRKSTYVDPTYGTPEGIVIQAIVFVVLTTLLGLVLVGYHTYVASRLKRGDTLFMVASLFWHVLTAILIILGGLGKPFDMLFGYTQPPTASDTLLALAYIPNGIYLLVSLWTAGVLIKYWKRMIKDGESFKKEPDYEPKKEKIQRRSFVTVFLAAPLLMMGFILLILTFAGALFIGDKFNPDLITTGQPMDAPTPQSKFWIRIGPAPVNTK